MAVIVVATIVPTPEHRDEVIAAINAAQVKVHETDEGCSLYALHAGQDGRLVMIEKYASDDAMAAHMKSDILAELRLALAGKLGAPMDVQLLEPLPAGSAEKGAL
jgi:quinol monooxygenase YgiN